jgi:DNA-directed RNA polymerase specialized sigma24 family protein
MREIDCTRADEDGLVALYLAGNLTESDAEAFELHYLGCDRCASALREGGEVRAALGKPVLVPAAAAAGRAEPGRDIWTLLAAAATVAMFFYGIRHLTERQDLVQDAAVLRSESAETLRLSVSAGPDGQVVLEWPSHPEADRYRIEIVRSDGLPVLESETADRRILLAIGDLPPRPAGVTLLARVEALNALRQVVAKSERQPLPGS